MSDQYPPAKSCPKCGKQQDGPLHTCVQPADTETPRTDVHAKELLVNQGMDWLDCFNNTVAFARTLERELNQAKAQLKEAEKWREDDPRMWREQCRIGDVAFQHLFCTSKLPLPDWVKNGLPNLYTTLQQLSAQAQEVERLKQEVAHCWGTRDSTFELFGGRTLAIRLYDSGGSECVSAQSLWRIGHEKAKDEMASLSQQLDEARKHIQNLIEVCPHEMEGEKRAIAAINAREFLSTTGQASTPESLA